MTSTPPFEMDATAVKEWPGRIRAMEARNEYFRKMFKCVRPLPRRARPGGFARATAARGRAAAPKEERKERKQEKTPPVAASRFFCYRR